MTDLDLHEVIGDYMAVANELAELADTSTDRKLAALARYYSPMVATAALAELDDPEPKDRSWCQCTVCQQWLLKARWHRIAGGSTV